MAVNWQHLAIAVSCRLEFERLCERTKLLSEELLVRTCVEFVQAKTAYVIVPEFNHPNLPGDQRLDCTGRAPNHNHFAFVLEAKWLKSEGGTRDWVKEVTHDILRLESLVQEINSATERILVVMGHQTKIQGFVDKTVQTGQGNVQILPHILQARQQNAVLPQNQARVPVRECNNQIRPFWRRMANQLHLALPVSYQVALVGHHVAGPTQDGVEGYVWRIRRSRKRSNFQVNYWD
jgi:hypothetical protein